MGRHHAPHHDTDDTDYGLTGNEEYTCTAAVDTAHALKSLVNAVRGIAATSPDEETNLALIDSARDVLDKSNRLLEEASRALADPNNPENQTRLPQVCMLTSRVSRSRLPEYLDVSMDICRTRFMSIRMCVRWCQPRITECLNVGGEGRVSVSEQLRELPAWAERHRQCTQVDQFITGHAVIWYIPSCGWQVVCCTAGKLLHSVLRLACLACSCYATSLTSHFPSQEI